MSKVRYVGFDTDYFELKRQTSVEFNHNGDWILIDILVTTSLSIDRNRKIHNSDYSAEFMCLEDISDLDSFEKNELLETAIMGLRLEDEDLKLKFGSFK